MISPQTNTETKNLETLGNNQVSSANIEPIPEILELPEMGDNSAMPEADTKKLEDQRLFDKFAYEQIEKVQDYDAVLSKTISEDTNVKRILGLACILANTDEEQRNAILTGPSSVGKTFNMLEVLWFFRNGEQVFELNDASPKSLIHSANSTVVDDRTLKPIDMSKQPKKGDQKETWDEWYDLKRHMANYIDLSRKILAVYDLKDYAFLESIRSLLSHDTKISTHLIADKSNGANRTKKVLIGGFCTAIFASAKLEMDEQECSRNYLLSPSDNPEKIRQAIELQARKKTDPEFRKWYETEPSRLGFKNRMQQIMEANIKTVLFKKDDMANLKDWFLAKSSVLTPKSQRDFPRLYAIAEAWALLNFKFRERTSDGNCIYANATDIEIAKQIYEPILQCNELGLTPEEYEVWQIIEPECNEMMGLRISEIHNIYYYAKKRHCSDKRLREMLKNFVCAGLLKEEKEGVIIKYYPITHKETKQSEFSTKVVDLTSTPFLNSNEPSTGVY
ncbi:MAG: hypothetical protein ACFCUE_11445 [Candidatus Bathyarchaeia archaeon]|jgi:hypothetical protein